MHIQPIGKGLFRITVKSGAKRARLANIPGIEIAGDRVIFTGEYYNQIRKLLERKPKAEKPEQLTLVF